MNYKTIGMLLLFPTISYGFFNTIGRDLRIAELENAKIQIQDEAVKLFSETYEAKGRLSNQVSAMFAMYTGPIDKGDKSFIPKKFNNFVLHLSYQFDAGEDIKPLIDNNFRKQEGTDIHLMCVEMLIQQLVVNRMTNQCRDLTKKLEDTNKELKTLYNMSAKKESC